MRTQRFRALVFILVVMILTMLACTRQIALPDETVGGGGEDAAAETKDAQVQMTLSVLLGSATAQSAEVEEDTATPEPPTEEPSNTPDTALQTVLALAQTEEAVEPTSTPSPQQTSTATSASSPPGTIEPTKCLEHRYVYDITYPDGTVVSPGETIEKTWRLQNVGTCAWTAGQYQVVFVEGRQMSGASPSVINYSVASLGYANFSITLTAPSEPGTYRGYWVLETTTGDTIGWGPNADQSFWVEIRVQ